MKLIRKEGREKLFFGRGILIHGHLVFFLEKEFIRRGVKIAFCFAKEIY